MLERCFERLEVVVVCFLQLLPDECYHAPVPVPAAQDFFRSPHVDQVPGPELVRLQIHAEHVAVPNWERLANGVMYLCKWV